MEYLNKQEKFKIIIMGIYKTIVFICWYLLAFCFAYFINHNISDNKVFILIILLVVIYTIRNIFKYLYKKDSYLAYYHIKHSVEITYFKKIKKIASSSLARMNKEDLANKILEYSYLKTKMVSDIIEFLIPAFIGLLFFFVGLFKINIILMFVVLILLLILLLVRHFSMNSKEIMISNYNDLLGDFIKKIMTIKKLNVFNFCENMLDNNKENDMIILKNNEVNPDIKFSTGLSFILAIVFISSYFFLHNKIDLIGYLLFFIIIISKLQSALYELNPLLKIILMRKKEKEELDVYFSDLVNYKYHANWKRISIHSGIVNYEANNITVKIPNFEFVKGDQISIIGKKGEGKSTILNILSGVDNLDSGVISIDNIKSNKLIEVIYLSKDMEIFNISLRDNLKFNIKINDEEIISLLKEIGLEDWYKTLPNGLDTIVNSNYINNYEALISRLNIVRGIILNKEVYFLDEPTQDIDIDIEKKIVSMIKKYFKKKTFIIITDRPMLTTICKKHYFMKKHTLLDKEPLL